MTSGKSEEVHLLGSLTVRPYDPQVGKRLVSFCHHRAPRPPPRPAPPAPYGARGARRWRRRGAARASGGLLRPLNCQKGDKRALSPSWRPGRAPGRCGPGRRGLPLPPAPPAESPSPSTAPVTGHELARSDLRAASPKNLAYSWCPMPMVGRGPLPAPVRAVRACRAPRVWCARVPDQSSGRGARLPGPGSRARAASAQTDAAASAALVRF